MSLLRSISAADFERWQPALKVITHEDPRKFAVVSLGDDLEVALSWRSDLIAPTIVPGAQSDLWIGVDQRVVCVDQSGQTLLSLALASSLLTIKRFARCVAVLCETEVIVFNADHTIRKVHGLSEMPNDIVEQDGKLVVSLEDGTQSTVG